MSERGPKILVIRFSSIGDIVLTTPIIRALRKQLNAELHFLIKDTYNQVLNANPYIHKLWFFNKKKGLQVLARELRSENFDHIIDLHFNLRSMALSALLGKNAQRFNKLNTEKWLMVQLKWNILPDMHIVERYFESCKSQGIKLDGEGLDFFISDENKVQPSDWVNGKFAVLAIGAAHATKQIPLSQLVPLLNAIDHPIVLVGGPGDLSFAQEITEGTNSHVISTVGQLNIQQTASLVEQSEYVMSPDTGVMHIAAAFKKPIVVFWGNTIKEFGMYPYYGNQEMDFKNIEVQGLSCRPCSKIGYEKCPKGHFLCMKAWQPDKVASEIKQYLRDRGLSMFHP